MAEQDFKSGNQFDKYSIELDRILAEKFENCEDIPNFTPDLEYVEERTSKTVEFLREYKKKLVEEP